jgi:hypothetical protein
VISYLGCTGARDMLQPFIDGELPTADQVRLESHLRWCDTCAARVEDLRSIGASLRIGATVPGHHSEDHRALSVIQSEVLTRIRAERDQSLAVRCRGLFSDMRFLWPAMGATVAVAVCVYAVMSVNRAARAELPYSMADRISALANPGSDRNPLQLDSRMLAPRPLDHGASLDLMPTEDVVFALAAVVTREGRVANFELLDADESAHVAALLEAVKDSRFTPARTSDGAVAVNVVWLLARTTVRASIDPNDSGSLAPLAAPAGRPAAEPAVSAERPRRAPRPARS